LKIQDGGGRHFEKIENLQHLSNGLTDFCEIWYATPFDLCDRPDRQNFEILKIQDGGGRHYEKSKYRHTSATI